MEIDVGVCKEHDRPYEGLCKNCECVICPSCVMFGSHKKHDIVSLREGAMYLRKAIDQEMFKGLLKKEFTETRILEIRENNLIMEKSKAETVKKIEEAFKGITQTLKQRKADIINDIIDKFNIDKKKIDDAEADWMLKQDISEKLVQFDTEQNSAFLLANSKFIMEGIRKLSEKIQFNELNVFNNILTSLIIEGKHDEDGNIVSPKEYSLEEIIYVLSKYISMGEPNVLSYKA